MYRDFNLSTVKHRLRHERPTGSEHALSPITQRVVSFPLPVAPRDASPTFAIPTWSLGPPLTRFELPLDSVRGSTTNWKTTASGSHEMMIQDLRLFLSPTRGTKSSLSRKSECKERVDVGSRGDEKAEVSWIHWQVLLLLWARRDSRGYLRQ